MSSIVDAHEPRAPTLKSDAGEWRKVQRLASRRRKCDELSEGLWVSLPWMSFAVCVDCGINMLQSYGRSARCSTRANSDIDCEQNKKGKSAHGVAI
jgi:hypothetical protein